MNARTRWIVLRCAAAAIAAMSTIKFAAPAIAAEGAVFPGAGAPDVAIEQRLGAPLPLGLRFVDADGRAVRLGDYFDRDADGRGVAVVLVLGYYRCPRLCQTVAQGAIEVLAESGVPPARYRVVAVSIDPEETAADASAARARDLAWADLAYTRAAASGTQASGRDGVAQPRIDALVGPAASVSELAAAAGFGVQRVDDTADAASPATFAHAAGFLVVTPEGRVSRYFLGVRHDPAALRGALDAADDDVVGGLVDRLVLLCAHLDPSLGRHSAAVMLVLRIVGVCLMLALAGWIWRHRRTPAVRPR